MVRRDIRKSVYDRHDGRHGIQPRIPLTSPALRSPDMLRKIPWTIIASSEMLPSFFLSNGRLTQDTCMWGVQGGWEYMG